MLLAGDAEGGDIAFAAPNLFGGRPKAATARLNNPARVPFGVAARRIRWGSDFGVVSDRRAGDDAAIGNVQHQSGDRRRAEVETQNERHRWFLARLRWRIQSFGGCHPAWTQ